MNIVVYKKSLYLNKQIMKHPYKIYSFQSVVQVLSTVYLFKSTYLYNFWAMIFRKIDWEREGGQNLQIKFDLQLYFKLLNCIIIF